MSISFESAQYGLICISIILLIIIATRLINQKTLKLPVDILLVLISFVFGIVIKLIFENTNPDIEFYKFIKEFDFSNFLVDGILCFLVFVGASKVNFTKFKQNIKNITVLSLFSTIITTFVYGALFYLLALITGLKNEFTIWICFMLGAIVAPTDPIAATSILNKLGLQKNVTSIIEGESLFNDGIGIALFLVFKGMATGTNANFALIMLQEVLGGLAIGIAIGILTFIVLKRTKNPIYHVVISLLAVTSSYAICEIFSFSGVIACVVIGIYYSYMFEKNKNWVIVIDPNHMYKDFWDVVDSILNDFLFVLVGLCVIFMTISWSWYLLLIMFFPIFIGLFSRFSGLYPASFLIGRKMPGEMNRVEFCTLLSWGGLKGALSMALALSLSGSFAKANQQVYNLILLVTFTTIIFSIVFQGLTIGKLYGLINTEIAKREAKSS